MNLLYGFQGALATVPNLKLPTLMVVLLLSGGSILNAQGTQGANQPLFWNDQISRQFLVPAIPQVPQDLDIGPLLIKAKVDRDTADASDFIARTFSDVIFGTILNTVAEPGSLFHLKRTFGLLKERVQPNQVPLIASTVGKAGQSRQFTLKVTGTSLPLLVELRVTKTNGSWRYDQVLGILELDTTPETNLSIQRHLFESEGWIPNGN